jgi:hypothetical protein
MKRLAKGEVVDITRDVTTRGGTVGEEGTGYRWEPCAAPGPFRHGHLEGYTEPAQVEILVEGASLQRSFGGELLFYPTGYPEQVLGLTVDEVLGLGMACLFVLEENGGE